VQAPYQPHSWKSLSRIMQEAALGGLFSLNGRHAACGFTTAYPRSDRACILVA
jgi:hypothetical protein